MTRRIATSVALVVGCACLAGATDLLSTKPGNPWDRSERALQKAGFDTDTDSLMSIAKTHQGSIDGWRAISILGWRGEHKAKGLLRELLAEGFDESVHQAAALALARLGDEEGLQALIQFFFQETGIGKAYLANRLAELGQDVGYSQTLELSYSSRAGARRESLRALVVLLDVLQDSPERTRELADRICAMSQDADRGVRREFLIQAASAIPASLRERCLEEVVRRMSVEEVDDALKEKAAGQLVKGELRREREKDGDGHEN